jgi:hypothetical protein
MRTATPAGGMRGVAPRCWEVGLGRGGAALVLPAHYGDVGNRAPERCARARHAEPTKSPAFLLCQCL